MAQFKMQERDLDLFILEELYSDTGFSDWLLTQVGRSGYVFVEAKHSVSAKAAAKWGETDVLAFFSRDGERIALLIEDKITARFTDQQAHRYKDRAEQIVREGEALQCETLLIAPRTYLTGVPKEDPWDHRLPIETLCDWFGQRDNDHARWRKQALSYCLTRLKVSSDRADVVRFGIELSAYLALHHSPTLWHRPGKDPAGPTIDYRGSGGSKILWWKVKKAQMTLQLADPYVGRIAHIKVPEGIFCEIADGVLRKYDNLVVTVPPIDFSIPLELQRDTVEAAIAAAYRLIAFVPEIEASIAEAT